MPINKRIKNIEFGLLSPEEIRKMSAGKIITADTYDDDGFPIQQGLMDPALGVIEPGLRCKTCGRKVDNCPGHFGHIDLAMPIIHVGYVKKIKQILQTTCRKCGGLLFTGRQISEIRTKIDEEKEKEIEEIITRCPHCDTEQYKITLDKPTSFRENGHKLTPKEVRERLERIKNEDLEKIGITGKDKEGKLIRPEWMVLTAFPIPPVTVRPSITLESGDRSEDDLTHKLVDVIRINQRLQENRDAGAPQLIVEDLWELLQYHITTYFDNQTSGIPPARHRSGRSLKTLTQRLRGKEGRFRSNLSGKRVNFSARTVISPEPNLSINEVGVPIEIARELTVSIRVNQYNLEKVKEFVKRGPNPPPPKGIIYLPGVNYIIRTDGVRIKITDKNAEENSNKIDIGYIVERQLMDGDIVLFNRQPSLHRMSMMAHEVRILPHKTFRFNLAVCPPYNADFDGDEMNLHVLQSEEARAEARILMKVQEHILSPRFGGSIIGGIHDHITGMFLLTYRNPKFTKEEVEQIISKIPSLIDRQLLKKEEWYGKELFSLLLPKELNIEFKASICQLCTICEKKKCKYDAYVVINNGKLICGTIDEKAIGAFKGKLLDKVVRDFGAEKGKDFIDNFTRMAIAIIHLRGFTTGIDDEDIPEEAKKQIEETLNNARKRVNELVESYNERTLEQMPGRSMEDTLEVEIMRVLGRARDDAGKIAGKHLGLDNSAVIMAKCGSRGSILNLSQMAGCIGQQAVRGERIQRGYDRRTLPHFKKGDLGSEARGFVKSSYKSGLSPTEFFFHCMGGREGLVDTAVRTSRSGYMQRRLINALEDLKVEYDRTVRNTIGTIIQFKYGEDGIDPSKSARGEAVDVDDIIKEIIGKVEAEKEEVKEEVAKFIRVEVEDIEPEIDIEDESLETEEFETEYEGD